MITKDIKITEVSKDKYEVLTTIFKNDKDNNEILNKGKIIIEKFGQDISIIFNTGCTINKICLIKSIKDHQNFINKLKFDDVFWYIDNLKLYNKAYVELEAILFKFLIEIEKQK